MMNCTVTKPLNVRVGRPTLSAPCFHYLMPGHELKTDGLFYKGEPFEGIDDWLKDSAGNFYWSGCVRPLEKSDRNQSDYWFKHLGIADIWHTYGEKGDLARVLILDTGINDLPVFHNAVIVRENFVKDSKNMFSNDPICHGTHCAGLIAARPSQYSVGIAPEAKLLVGKISENGLLRDGTTIRAALEKFLDPKYDFDIISISAAVMQEDLKMKELLEQHIKANRIIVASIGNDPLSYNTDYKKYPGYFDNCISVGACEYDLSVSKYTCSPNKASIYCFGSHVGSYKKGPFPEPLQGTSQATAMLAGICALIVSFLKKKNRPFDQEFIRHLLKTHSEQLGDFKASLINPTSLFEFLNTI